MIANIVPVTVFPAKANVLFVRSGSLGPPPSYYYQLQEVISATETTPEVVNILKDGNTEMTQAQWDNWDDSIDDEEYQLSCVATNVGLTLA